MEISQMRYFRTIAQCGSFSIAAQQLHVTQPALSKSIAKLEGELGAPLFERKANRISLTPAGRIFLNYCAVVLDAVESGINAVKESVGLKQGHLAIAISSEVFLKHLILNFLKEYPEISFTCHLMSVEEMARALEEGRIDFALSEQPVLGDGVEWHCLHSGYLTAVLNDQDPLLSQDSIAMEDLRDRQFCVGHLRSNLHSSVFELCAAAGFRPRIRYLGYDPDITGLLLTIPNSVIISSDSIDAGLRTANVGNSRYRALPIRGTEGKAVIGVAVRVGHYQSEASLAFYDMVADYFCSLG